MRPPPSPADFLKYPIIVGVGALAAVVMFAWHSGKDISPLFMDYRVWHGEPWRLLTSALPHVDLLHLLFNLYWLWVFGSAVEAAFGPLRTAAIILFFAGGSAAAEYAIFEGGVGLSGVGYGLFGLLWVLSTRDDRFRDVVDGQTIGLFVVWFFFLRIVTTVSGAWAVANVAHGMGAAEGILLGFAIAAQRGKVLVIACLAGLMFAVFMAATVGRPFVNFSGHAGEELAYSGYFELEAGRNESAIAMYERAVRLNDRQALWWYNLGIAYQRSNRLEDATHAYKKAVYLNPDDRGFQAALKALSGTTK